MKGAACGAVAVALVALLSGCSKRVEWKEEVPLNNGQTIWVQRSAVYERVLTGPLALQLGWRIGEETIEFEWGQSTYRFVDAVSPTYLVIDFTSKPVLIAVINGRLFERYGCRTPFYIEWRPLQDKGWKVSEKLNAAFEGVRANLLHFRNPDPRMPSVIRSSDRERLDYEQFNWGSKGLLTTDYVDPRCK
jgi:hypothetical protein